LLEDGVSFVLVWLTAAHPILALLIVFVLGIVAVYIILKLSHFTRRVFRRT
jgi:hypothetical protein